VAMQLYTVIEARTPRICLKLYLTLGFIFSNWLIALIDKMSVSRIADPLSASSSYTFRYEHQSSAHCLSSFGIRAKSRHITCFILDECKTNYLIIEGFTSLTSRAYSISQLNIKSVKVTLF